MDLPDAQSAADKVQGLAHTPRRSPWRFTLDLLVLLFGALTWVVLVSGDFLSHWVFTLPPLGWAVPLALVLLRARRWVEVIGIVLILPLAVAVNAFALMLLVSGVAAVAPTTAAGGPSGLLQPILAMLLSAGWLALGLWRCRGLAKPMPAIDGDAAGESSARSYRWRRAVGLIEMLVFVAAFMPIAANAIFPAGDGYSVRARVSELILAGSSAKMALSEGLQTYGSFSPEWMSAITISPTGMVKSATIGPSGQIVVYGTAATSNSVVTMTPSMTTDNKLVWTCVGKPVKYMPASCR